MSQLGDDDVQVALFSTLAWAASIISIPPLNGKHYKHSSRKQFPFGSIRMKQIDVRMKQSSGVTLSIYVKSLARIQQLL